MYFFITLEKCEKHPAALHASPLIKDSKGTFKLMDLDKVQARKSF